MCCSAVLWICLSLCSLLLAATNDGTLTVTPQAAGMKAYMGTPISLNIHATFTTTVVNGDNLFLTFAKSAYDNDVVFEDNASVACYPVSDEDALLAGSVSVSGDLQVVRVPVNTAYATAVVGGYDYEIVCPLTYARVLATQPTASAFIAPTLEDTPRYSYPSSIPFPISYTPYHTADTAITRGVVPITDGLPPITEGAERIYGQPVKVVFTIDSPRAAAWTSTTAVRIQVTQGAVLNTAVCHKNGDTTKTYPVTTDPEAKTISVVIGVPTDATALSVVCSGARNPTLEETIADAGANPSELSTNLLFDMFIAKIKLDADADATYPVPIHISPVDFTLSTTKVVVANAQNELTFTLNLPNSQALALIPDEKPAEIRFTAASGPFPFFDNPKCATTTGADIPATYNGISNVIGLHLIVPKDSFVKNGDAAGVTITCNLWVMPTIDINAAAPLRGHVRVFNQAALTALEQTVFFAADVNGPSEFLPDYAEVVQLNIKVEQQSNPLPDNAIASLKHVLSWKIKKIIDAVLLEKGISPKPSAFHDCLLTTNTITDTTAMGSEVSSYSNDMIFRCLMDYPDIAGAVVNPHISPEKFTNTLSQSIAPWSDATTSVSLLQYIAAYHSNVCKNRGLDVYMGMEETDIDCGGIYCERCEGGKTCATDADCVQYCDSLTSKCATVERSSDKSTIVRVPIKVDKLNLGLPDNALASLKAALTSHINRAVTQAVSTNSLFASLEAADCTLLSNALTQTTNGEGADAMSAYSQDIAFGCSIDSPRNALVVTNVLESKSDVLTADLFESIRGWGTPVFTLSISPMSVSTYTNTCLNGEVDASNGETDVDCGGNTCAPCEAGKTCAADSDCVQTCDQTSQTCRGVERAPGNSAARAAAGIFLAVILCSLLML